MCGGVKREGEERRDEATVFHQPSLPPHNTSYYITRHSLHSLPDVALLRFKDEVYVHVHVAARDAILSAVAARARGGAGGPPPAQERAVHLH